MAALIIFPDDGNGTSTHCSIDSTSFNINIMIFNPVLPVIRLRDGYLQLMTIEPMLIHAHFGIGQVVYDIINKVINVLTLNRVEICRKGIVSYTNIVSLSVVIFFILSFVIVFVSRIAYRFRQVRSSPHRFNIHVLERER